MDSKEKILKYLKKFLRDKQEEYFIDAIGIFGSVARGEALPDSDIDVVVKLKKENLFNLAGLHIDLEKLFGISVDVVSYHADMNPFLKKRIDIEAIYV